MPENTGRAFLESSMSYIGYIWLFVLAIWGGTASYISRIKKLRAPFSIAELLGEWVISGFAGVVTAYFCHAWGLDYYATAAMVAIAGHMGGRGIVMLELYVQKIWVKRFGNSTINRE